MARTAARRSIEEEQAPTVEGDGKLHALPRRKDMPAPQDGAIKSFVPETKAQPRREAAPPAPKQARRRGSLRAVLLIAGPVLVLAGVLYFYLAGGGFASADDAYVQTGIIFISTHFSRIVTKIEVPNNQHRK